MNPRKKQILDAAHRLFIEKGFSLTSIQDILKEAGIAKGTFYNHFRTKNECLVAILEHVSDETQRKRQKLALGKRKDDQHIFIQQILVRMKANREQNLLALFESVFYSKDDDLKTFMRIQHKKELNWVAGRMVDLFGINTKHHALDYASILFGITHHMMHVWMLRSKKEYDLEEIIHFSLKRLEAIIQKQDTIGAPFFPANWLGEIKNTKHNDRGEIKKEIISRLEKLLTVIKEAKINEEKIQYVEFLLSEFQSKEPRHFLIESIIYSIRNKFTFSVFKNEMSDIIQIIRLYIEHNNTD